MQALAARLRQQIAQGEQALDQRRKAATGRADHRVRSITTLVDDINGARLSLFGSLTKKAAEARLPRDWPGRFFQHTTRVAKADPVAPGPQPAPA